MATYGRDYYGRAKYGGRQRFELAVDPFEANPMGFNSVVLSWSEPGGDWSGFRIIRSRSGFPISETDGAIVVDFPVGYSGATGGSVLDTSLTGGWHYYGLFLWDNGAQVWERAAAVDVMVPYDFKSTDRLWDLVPEYYKTVYDNTADYNQQKYRVNPAIYMGHADAVPNLAFAKYLHIIGWGMDILRTQADQVMDGYNINSVHVNRLALLAEQFGGEVEESAPASTNRSMVRNLGWLYRKKGTLEGIREMVSLVTGWEIDVEIGPNLMLSEDQANFQHPEPQWWDEGVKYDTQDRVRYGMYVYIAIQPSYGPSTAPPSTRTSNTWWDHDATVDPVEYPSTHPRYGVVYRTDTGDVSTWQIQGPSGFISGSTKIGSGTQDPEDGTIHYTNSLMFRNETVTDGADFIVRSIPRHALNLGSWDRTLIITDGIPTPKAHKEWDATVRYRNTDVVLYEGSPWEAVGTSEGVVPSDSALEWKRLGYDDRIRLALSWYSHGPFNGTPGTGGLRNLAVITEFDEEGDMVNDTVCLPEVYTNFFYDPFNTSGSLTTGRVGAKGTWSANNSGTWGQAKDEEGGYVYPPTAAARTYQLAPALLANGRVAVTYQKTPGTRLMGVIFRWSDASNYWIATQTGLYKVVAGAAVANPDSGSLTWTPFIAGDRLMLDLNGSTIQVYKNEVLLGTATDTFNQDATRHGVGAEA